MADEWELVVVTKKTRAALLDGAVRLERKIFPKNESWGDGLLEEAAKAHFTMVLAVKRDDAETVGGYILFRRTGVDGMIDKLAVAESWRRRGVGRRLLRFAIDTLRAKRCTFIHLLVDVERLEARALYDSEEFEMLSTRKDYYRVGRDALWMELRL